MPRVQPKTTRPVDPNLVAAHDAAARDYTRDRKRALADAVERHGLAPIQTAERSAYGIGSKHSYFRDLALAAVDSANRTHRDSDGHLIGQLDTYRDALYGGPEDSRARLATVETRAGTTAATAGGNFVINTAPRYIADQFAEFARNAAVLSTVFPVEPIPDVGMDIYTARITTGTAVTPQATENNSVGTQDIVEAKTQTSPVGMISGYLDVSIQLDDRADPAFFDVVCARELGSALGAQLDAQLLSGTGANGQLLGLISVTGINTVAYTDASPSQAEAWPKLMQGVGDLAVALGNVADTILMHPRRGAWFHTWKDSSTGMQSNLNWPAPVVNVPSIPTNLGAGTNEDFALAVRASELPIFLGPVQLEAHREVGSSTGTVRIVARQYAATLFGRRPEAVTKISGTGFGGVTYA